MKTINIGKLNKRVTFKKLGETKDDMGQTTQRLIDICTVWASFYPVRGFEKYELQKIQSLVTHKCYIRYRKGIDTNCYMEYNGVTYSIQSVIDIDLEHKLLEIMCTEKGNSEMME